MPHLKLILNPLDLHLHLGTMRLDLMDKQLRKNSIARDERDLLLDMHGYVTERRDVETRHSTIGSRSITSAVGG